MEYALFQVTNINEEHELDSEEEASILYSIQLLKKSKNTNLRNKEATSIFAVDTDFSLKHPKQTLESVFLKMENDLLYYINPCTYVPLQNDLFPSSQIQKNLIAAPISNTNLKKTHDSMISSVLLDCLSNKIDISPGFNIENELKIRELNSVFQHLEDKSNFSIFLLSSSKTIYTKFDAIVWELFYQKTNYSPVLIESKPHTFESIKPFLESLLKGIPSELFIFDFQELEFKVNPYAHLRISGTKEQITSDYLLAFRNYGTKVLLINEISSAIMKSNDPRVESVREFYTGISDIVFKIIHSIACLFNGDRTSTLIFEPSKKVKSFAGLLKFVRESENYINHLTALLKINTSKEKFLTQASILPYEQYPFSVANSSMSCLIGIYMNDLISLSEVINQWLLKKTDYLLYFASNTKNLYYTLLSNSLRIIFLTFMDVITRTQSVEVIFMLSNDDSFKQVFPEFLLPFRKKIHEITLLNKIMFLIDLSFLYSCTCFSGLFTSSYSQACQPESVFTVVFISEFRFIKGNIFSERLRILSKTVSKLTYEMEELKCTKMLETINRLQLKRERSNFKEKFQLKLYQDKQTKDKLSYFNALAEQIKIKKQIVEEEVRILRQEENLALSIEIEASQMKSNLIAKYKELYKSLVEGDRSEDIISNYPNNNSHFLVRDYVSQINQEASKSTKNESYTFLKKRYDWRNTRQILDEKRKAFYKNEVYNQVLSIPVEIKVDEDESMKDVNRSMNDLSIQDAHLFENCQDNYHFLGKANTDLFEISNQINIPTSKTQASLDIDEKMNIKDILPTEVTIEDKAMPSELFSALGTIKVIRKNKVLNNDIMVISNEYEAEEYMQNVGNVTNSVFHLEKLVSLNSAGKGPQPPKSSLIKQDKASKKCQMLFGSIQNQISTSTINELKSQDQKETAKSKSKTEENRKNLELVPFYLYFNEVFFDLTIRQHSICSKAYYNYIEIVYGYDKILTLIENIFFLSRGDLYFNFLDLIIDYRSLRLKSSQLQWLVDCFFSNEVFGEKYFGNLTKFSGGIEGTISSEVFRLKELLKFRDLEQDVNTLDIVFSLNLNTNLLPFSIIFNEQISINLSKIQTILFNLKRYSATSCKLVELIIEKKRHHVFKLGILQKRKKGQGDLVDEATQKLEQECILQQNYLNYQFQTITTSLKAAKQVDFYIENSILYRLFKKPLKSYFKLKEYIDSFELSKLLESLTKSVLFELQNGKIIDLLTKYYLSACRLYIKISVSDEEEGDPEEKIILKKIEHSSKFIEKELEVIYQIN